jgi:hypothetical protein
MLAARAQLLIVTLWVGSLWTIGYLVAPTLFATLSDKMLAGTIAGKLFRIEAWLSVVCAIIMIILIKIGAQKENPKIYRRLLWLVLGMLACTLVGYFGLQPFMAALRETAGAGVVLEGDARMQFGILHGVASALYLIQSLLGVVLVWKLW